MPIDGIDDLYRLERDLTTAANRADGRASAVVRKSLFDISAKAKGYAPVDTGNLKSSIGVSVDSDGLGGEVGPTASYGVFVELGTSQHAPQPYLHPGFDQVTPDFLLAMQEIGDLP